ncbi:hypothetical protein HJ01_02670 [Flavobacterium frigoris PS1]|uniref:Uncharacterized protein n=1 Tax=Flavobacterium frigoris (strain PS1) TaxID=1086011 RepID=H7FUC5_FLAFP|nr:hypothetical protein HJ01_02670 [Flavobacterium frigoris PS1]
MTWKTQKIVIAIDNKSVIEKSCYLLSTLNKSQIKMVFLYADYLS